jgi:hypothetical protein
VIFGRDHDQGSGAAGLFRQVGILDLAAAHPERSSAGSRHPGRLVTPAGHVLDGDGVRHLKAIGLGDGSDNVR